MNKEMCQYSTDPLNVWSAAASKVLKWNDERAGPGEIVPTLDR